MVLSIAALAVTSGFDGVPASITSHLNRGVNITRWFCYEGVKYTPAQSKSYWTEGDTAWLKKLKVDYVRLCISPDYVYANGQPKPGTLTAIDSAVAKLTNQGLAIIWDLHDNGQLKLDAEGQDNKGFISFWKAVATHYKGKNYGNMMFELVNEPVFQKNAPVWYALQQQTVKAVRAIDPKRTMLMNGNGWGGIEGLDALPPLPEHNLVYSAHCYDPFFFTHQGASWVGPEIQALKNVPYPSSPEAVAKMQNTVPPQQQGMLQDYGKQHYNRAYLLGRLKRVSDWGKKHGKFVVLGEFGAYPPVSPPVSRRAWFADIRSVYAELKLSNCIWGYDDGLGLGRKIEGGKVILDKDTLAAFFNAR